MAGKKKGEEPEAMSYGEAARELQAILDELETGAADIDVLSQRVERAAALIRICRVKLEGTELRVQKIVEELAAETDNEEEGETGREE
jgi:exodeoxyribonuclease VII small subunit